MECTSMMKYVGSQQFHSSPRQGKPVTWRRELDSQIQSDLEREIETA
jgi:hypothetical protein